MMPGMGNFDPKQMAKMMKQLGIENEQVNAKKVIIEAEGSKIIIENPEVTKIKMKGQATFQISGEIKEESQISDEDAKMVAESAQCSQEEAKQALEDANGDIAGAIMNLQKKKASE